MMTRKLNWSLKFACASCLKWHWEATGTHSAPGQHWCLEKFFMLNWKLSPYSFHLWVNIKPFWFILVKINFEPHRKSLILLSIVALYILENSYSGHQGLVSSSGNAFKYFGDCSKNMVSKPLIILIIFYSEHFCLSIPFHKAELQNEYNTQLFNQHRVDPTCLFK